MIGRSSCSSFMLLKRPFVLCYVLCYVLGGQADRRYFFFNFMGRGGGSLYSILEVPALRPFGPGSSTV